MSKELNVILQGIVLNNASKIAQILVQAATQEGVPFKGADDTFQVIASQPEVCFLRFGEEVHSGFIPRGRCDVLVGCLPGEATRMAAEFLKPGGTVIMNTRDIQPTILTGPSEKYPSVQEILDMLKPLTGRMVLLDAVQLAKEAGDRYAMNFVMLGALAGSGVLPFSEQVVLQTVKTLVPWHDREVALRAYQRGLESFSGQHSAD